MANRRMLLLTLFLVAPLAAFAVDSGVGSKERPVAKVLRLLTDMRAELQTDLDDDKAVHEQLSCWCKENDREKTAAIEAGAAKQSELEAFLQEATAKMAELANKDEQTSEEVHEDEAAQEEASALRMKENEENHAEESNLIEAKKACDQAVIVLGNPTKPSFAQMRSVAENLQRARVLELGQRSPGASALRTFVKHATGTVSFLALPDGSAITGIMDQMGHGFSEDLKTLQASEEKAASEHSNLHQSKEDEITAGRKLKTELDEQIADMKEKHAQAFKELQDTKEQMELDKTFLSNLKEKCSMSGDEFETRVQDRLKEIAAVDDTIKILNDDEAFKVFDDTFDVALIQTSSTSGEMERLRRAASVLQQAAADIGSPELSLLATRAQLDAFTKVKEEIDKMVAELKKQQQDEVEHRDYCKEEFTKNKGATEEKYEDKESLQTKIADLEKTIEYLHNEIGSAMTAVAEMQQQMKRASENREGENADAQKTITDQRLTQMILNKAIQRMQQAYAMLQQRAESQPGGPHIATSGTDTEPGNGPARFSKYEKNAGGSRILDMLETIKADCSKVEDEAIRTEQDAQEAYENLMKDSNSAISKYTEKVVNMKGSKAKGEEELVMAKEDFKATMSNLEELHSTNGDLHKSCDFIMDTFDKRQAARAAEVDAMNEAKAILSGAN